jgi:hypothetical protein
MGFGAKLEKMFEILLAISISDGQHFRWGIGSGYRTGEADASVSVRTSYRPTPVVAGYCFGEIQNKLRV